MRARQSLMAAFLASPMVVACRDRFRLWRAIQQAKNDAAEMARLEHLETVLLGAAVVPEPSATERAAFATVHEILQTVRASPDLSSFKRDRHRLRVASHLITAEVDRMSRCPEFVGRRHRRPPLTQAGLYGLAAAAMLMVAAVIVFGG